MLYVPVGTRSAYEANECWKNFSTIVELDDYTSKIENVVDTNKTSVVYDLQGRKVNSQKTHGIFIENGRKILR